MPIFFMNIFHQRQSDMGVESTSAWSQWSWWRRVLKGLMVLGYLGLAFLGLLALVQFVRPHAHLDRWLTLQSVAVEVSKVPRAQPLDISKVLDEIKKTLEGKGYWEARRLLKQRIAQEDWVSQTWVSFDFPQKLQVTLVPHYIWGYVFLTGQKRFRAITPQGDLLTTPVITRKVADVTHQIYFQGSSLEKLLLQRIQKDYDQLNEVASRLGFSISQYAVDPQKGTTAYLSNGVSVVQPQFWDEPMLLRLEQTFHFLNSKMSEINSIQFISSKKVVVSFRR